MLLFERPPIYALTHILMGFVGAWYPTLLVLAVVYQFVQYIFNFRFFIFEMTVRSGNSFDHTGLKLLEMFFGYFFGILTKKFIKTL